MSSTSLSPPFETLVELLRARAAYGSRVAFTFLADREVEGPHLTYGELETRARSIGAFLQGRGASGQRALLFYPPGLDFLTAFWGCLYAGVVGVPVFPARLPRHLPRLSAIVADSQARLVLTTSRIGARSEELCKRAGDLATLRWCSTDNVSPDLAAQWCEPDVNPQTLAFLQYTSGSTGTPRGVMVSHDNLLHNSAAIQRVFGFRPDSLGLTWLPHYHDMGLIGCLLQPIYAGCSSVVMPPASFLQRPFRWLDAVTRYRVTTIVGPNFAYDLCERKITPEQRATLRLDSIEVALTGAEPVRSQTLDRFAETFGPCGFRKQAFHPAYGLAEATLIVSGHSRRSEAKPGPLVYTLDSAALQKNCVQPSSAESPAGRALVACGAVVRDTKVVIVDPESLTPCAPDRIGEIWVSGPGVAQGYWSKPKETAETFGARISSSGEGPFLRTGDLGFLRDGELVIAGRFKDLIIIRGANHYSQDLEQTVEMSHRALRPGCGAAFSVEALGEERVVIVYEIEDAEHLAGEEIAEAIRNALVESHEVSPYAVVLIEPRTIFRTSSGKIQRFACRDAFLTNKLAVVSQWREEDAVENGVAAATNRPRSGLVWDHLSAQSPARRAAVNPPEARAQAQSDTRTTRAEPIAIVGLGCRFPGAENPQALWRLLREGGDAITKVPADRWDVDELYDPIPGTPGKMSTRWGGFLKGVDLFDPHFFGISPREASIMDPQQRLLLEITWEALESAGQAPEKLAGSKTGVFVGIGGFDYSHVIMNYERHLERLNAYAGTGMAHSIAANRLSYLLDLRGPSVALDTACSSSLVAIHLACQSLRTRQSDLTLAGGVNLILSPEATVAFSHAHMMASDGRCKTFDAKADGYVRGEGCGMVVLKRLSDAVRDRDNILALLKGSSVNQDGRTAGISAPNGVAQQAVIREALEQAGVAPRELSYIEIHGTGTPVGDPIEVEAVKAVLGETDSGDLPCLLGSVKANIGHLENASGVAGLAKVILCLQHGEIPAQLHLTEVNPRISLDNTRISISRELQPWPQVSRRVAGVNSFGFGGTNAHVTVEQAPSVARPTDIPRRPLHIFSVSARTAGALSELAVRFASHLAEFPDEEIADICFTVNAGRSHFSHRLAVVTENKAQLHDALTAFVAGRQTANLESGHATRKNGPRVAFLFPGEGSEYAALTRPLFESQPVFRLALEECSARFSVFLERPLLPVIFSPGLQNQEHAIPPELPYRDAALFAVEYAMAKLWMSWGIKPDAVVGHGVGEYVAAIVAGVFSFEDAVRLVTERGRLLAGLSGNAAPPEMALDEFQASAARANFQKPRGLFVSSSSDKALAGSEIPDAGYWRRQLQNPVIFQKGIAALQSGQVDVFLQLWPSTAFDENAHTSLSTGFAADWLRSLHPTEGVWHTLLQSLSKLYLRGSAVDWDEFDRPYQPRKLSLPTYPFERERYWEDPGPSDAGHTRPHHPLLGRQLVSALPTLQFETKLGLGSLRFLKEHRIHGSPVLPASAYLEMALAASAEIFGPGSHCLENVMFHRAAFVPEDGTRTLQMTVSPAFGGSATFQVFGLDTGEDNAGWTLHASGEMRMDSSLEPASPTDHQSLLREIQDRCPEKGIGADFYSELRERGLGYGPAFQGVDWYCRGYQEALAQVSIAAGKNGDLENYQIHPALLDSCFHALAAAVSRDEASFHSSSIYLPTALAGLRLFARPGRRLFSHCSLRPDSRMGAEFLEADIHLLDERGRVLGELTGLKVSRVGSRVEPEVRDDVKGWLYELTWVPKPADSQPREIESPETGCWLIFGDRAGLGAALAKLIESHGGTCTLIRPGESRPGGAHQVGDDGSYRGVIYLSGLDIRLPEGAALSFADAQNDWLAVLHLVQTFVKLPSHTRPRLWMVTRGAQATGSSPAAISPAAAPLWGFARSVDLEHPELRFSRVDLDPGGALDESRLLFEELSLQPSEREVAYRHGVRYAPRLLRQADKSARSSGINIPNAPSFRLDTSRPGSFENLILRPAPRTAPGIGEVEIQVRAAGLNFRDVMNATGLYPGGPIPFGAECTGTISTVGPDVTELRVGDEVIAVASGSFAAYVVADARAVVRKPDGLGWPGAATIPITFLTAYYALHRLAGLTKDERILIHAAAGGVGLAAIQIARRAGAEIFATAGTAEKRDYLESLGVHHVMDSRSLGFASEIMRITGGKGVDVVLNSLPGEFAVKSLGVLGAYGRFVEIGKTDIYQNKQMGLFPFRNNLSYFACDLERLCRERPVLIRTLFLELMDLFREGELQPLPLQCFPIDEVAKAFRYMAGRKNLGKVVITFDTVAASAPHAQSRELRNDSTYMITGGLGSLGLSVALWMAGKGVRNLVLVGRSGAASEYGNTVLRDLEDRGVRVLALKADVTDASQLSRVLSTVREGMPPLRGIIHAAGVLDDHLLSNLTDESFLRVVAPKIQGAWNLHTQAATLPLDFFVLFSSIASITGSPGQANYAAGNAFLDALAHFRRGRGLPATAINWGPWGEVGMAARQSRVRAAASRAISPMPVIQGLIALDRILEIDPAEIVVVSAAWAELARSFGGRESVSLISDLLDEEVWPPKEKGEEAPKELISSKVLVALDPVERHALMLAHLKQSLAHVMGQEGATLDPEESLNNLGMDSLMALEVQHSLETSLRLKLPMEILMGMPSLNELSRRLLALLLSTERETPQETVRGSSAPSATLPDPLRGSAKSA